MQNRSSAVMQQRVDPPDSLDFFPTPPWGTRALCVHVLPRLEGAALPGATLSGLTAWDPACGRGDMTRPLGEYFAQVWGTDIFDYGIGAGRYDFRAARGLGGGVSFGPDQDDQAFGPIDWIVTNPPFNRGATFARHGLALARVGVALLVRLAFLEGIGRYKGLFRDNPPAIVAQFVERIPMFKGCLDPVGSSATAYAWIVWRAGPPAAETRFLWIPPCRAELERHGDYDGYDVAPGARPGRPNADLFV